MSDLDDIKDKLDKIQTLILYSLPKDRLKVLLENEPDFPKEMIEDVMKQVE